MMVRTTKLKDRRLNCVICNKIFIPKSGHSQTCSEECRLKLKSLISIKSNNRNIDKHRAGARKYAKTHKEAVSKQRKNQYKKDDNIKIRNQTYQKLKKEGFSFNGVCSDCGNVSKLEIHHLKYTLDDYLLICKNCHYKRHNKVMRIEE